MCHEHLPCRLITPNPGKPGGLTSMSMFHQNWKVWRP